jgi:hypothetical protein
MKHKSTDKGDFFTLLNRASRPIGKPASGKSGPKSPKPSIIAESKLVNVSLQVLPGNLMESPVNAALQLAPKPFD